MGERTRQQALFAAAVFHGLLACAWFVLGVLAPSAGALRDGLLLVPTFVATGVLTLTDGRFGVDGPRRRLAWTAGFLALIGIPPVALYMTRLVLARDSPLLPGDTRWTTGIDVTIAALVLLSLTALTHLYTVAVSFYYVYAARPAQ